MIGRAQRGSDEKGNVQENTRMRRKTNKGPTSELSQPVRTPAYKQGLKLICIRGMNEMATANVKKKTGVGDKHLHESGRLGDHVFADLPTAFGWQRCRGRSVGGCST